MDVAGQLCYTDAYLRSVEARVMAVDDGGEAPIVVLDRTVFYPGGGGQPSDRGVTPAGGRRPVVDRPRRRGSRAATSSTSWNPATAAGRRSATSCRPTSTGPGG